MAILTDLPNELLLSIVPDVSPVYIESFALSCKRVYYLYADTIREYNLTRNKVVGLQENELLRAILLNPRLALYPTQVKLSPRHCDLEHCALDSYAPNDLHVAMDTQICQNRYADLLNPANTRYVAAPWFITRLLNVQKMEAIVGWCKDLVKIVSQILEDSYEPGPTMREPLALGRLTEVHVSSDQSISCEDATELAILLAMIPSLRKLRVDCLSETGPHTSDLQHRCSGVTEIIIGRYIYMSSLTEIVGRTTALRRLTYDHFSNDYEIEPQPRCLIEFLKQCAGQSLTYLSFLSHSAHYPGQHRQPVDRNHNDLSLGSLRGFTVLKTLVTSVDIFIKTRHRHCEDQYPGYTDRTETVQRLTSWLPTSLETLVLHQVYVEWEKDVLRMLFRGLRSKKQERLPNLKLINFVRFPNFDQVIPDDLKLGCREMGVKVGYTLNICYETNCGRRLEELNDWERRPWVGPVVGDYCEHVSWVTSTDGI